VMTGHSPGEGTSASGRLSGQMLRSTPETRADGQTHGMQYDGLMLRYHIAFYLPRAAGEMVVAEALDFPGAVTQGFDLADARLMMASAMEDLAQCLLEEGKPLPTPNPDAAADADLVELVPLTVHVGALRV
jgi:predicted RNase H-like HicB family nuclease